MTATRESLTELLAKYAATPIFQDGVFMFGNKQPVHFQCCCGESSKKAIRDIHRAGAYCKTCQKANKSHLIADARRLPAKETTITDPLTQRACSECHRVKPKGDFTHAQQDAKETTLCSVCREKKRRKDAKARERGKKRKVPDELVETLKKCSKCFRIKSVEKFTIGNNNCKSCNKHSRTGYKKVKEIAKTINEDNLANAKMCVRCWIVADEEKFTTDLGHVGVVCDACRFYIDIYKSVYNDSYVKLKKEMGPCIDCGENDLKVLDFDHIDRDSKFMVVSACRSVSQLEDEAAKCVIRCSICHTRRSKMQLNYRGAFGRESRKEHVDQRKVEAAGCEECGYFDPTLLEALHWDHLDRTAKDDTVSNMVRNLESLERIDEEIAKCRLLCTNCHRKHTYVQLGYKIYD